MSFERDCERQCRVILEVDPQVIAQRVAMRSDSDGDLGGLAAIGEQVRNPACQWCCNLNCVALLFL
jgi:hypothetical protein